MTTERERHYDGRVIALRVTDSQFEELEKLKRERGGSWSDLLLGQFGMAPKKTDRKLEVISRTEDTVEAISWPTDLTPPQEEVKKTKTVKTKKTKKSKTGKKSKKTAGAS